MYEAAVPAAVEMAKWVLRTAGNRLMTICCVTCTTANVNASAPNPVPYDLVKQSKYALNPGRVSSKCSLSAVELLLFMVRDNV